MTSAELESALRQKVSAEVHVEQEGIGRYVVYTPFTFDDGDHFVIILLRDGGNWTLTDEGHTLMHLSYGGIDLMHGTRKTVVDQALTTFGLSNREGELRLAVPGESFGDALFSFGQALVKVSDTAYWSRERVRSTFLDDLRAFLEETVPASRRTFNYSDRSQDPDGLYPVDCRVNGMVRPLHIFGINNEEKCNVATITTLSFEKWGIQAGSLGVFEDQARLNSKTVARFTDVAQKVFSSLGQKERIRKHIAEALASQGKG